MMRLGRPFILYRYFLAPSEGTGNFKPLRTNYLFIMPQTNTRFLLSDTYDVGSWLLCPGILKFLYSSIFFGQSRKEVLGDLSTPFLLGASDLVYRPTESVNQCVCGTAGPAETRVFCCHLTKLLHHPLTRDRPN